MTASSTDDTLAASGDASLPAPRVGSTRQLARGALVGRYVVLSVVGTGGMGVVHEAYDPELHRKVALKLLHPGDADRDASHGSRRLLREAQAVARLSHPNVISVHDVGEHDGRVYLAMEFVEGTTLGKWCKTEVRRWPELLEVFLAAGRGLAAAHAVGLVHRDFKPDNVMVGPDPQALDAIVRPRVMDFGLARSTDTGAREDAEAHATGVVAAPVDEVTRTGAIVGTPAYMAPEQYSGLDVGPAADQFAFCVALWEALYGERPFTGTSLPELMVNVTAGKRRPPPPGTRVPAWLRRICERGLSTAPDQRFATMQELLSTLQRGRARARARRVAAAIAAVAVIGASALSYRSVDRGRRVAACEADGASIEAVWSPEREASIRGALRSSGPSYAEQTEARLVPLLDDRARAWATARTQACVSAPITSTSRRASTTSASSACTRVSTRRRGRCTSERSPSASARSAPITRRWR